MQNFNESPEFFGFKNIVPFFGVVEDISDPMKLGRARVRIFGIHPEDRQDVPTWSLPWATVMMPTTSAGQSGIGTTPQLIEGSWVFGMLLDGEKAQFPFVMGTIPGQHKGNAPGYGGAAASGSTGSGSGEQTPRSGTNNSQTHGQSAVTGATPTQSNNPKVSANISDDGSYLTHKDDGSVKFNNYQLKDFAPSYFSKPQFRFHRPTAFAVDKAASTLGKKLQINSGWRTFGDPRRHPTGHAVDISIRSMSPSEVYRFLSVMAQCGFNNFGIEYTYIHCDTTNHMPGTLYAYPYQGAKTGSSSVFNNRSSTGQLQHSEILKALEGAGWRRGRTRSFELSKNSGTGSGQPTGDNTAPANDIMNNAAQTMGMQRQQAATGSVTSDNNWNTLPFTRIGFKDPTNSYPRQDYRGVSAINQSARGLNDDVHQVAANAKEAGRIINFPVSFDKATFGEPANPYNAAYPYNHVISSRAGHMIEMDSTPNSERLNIWSPAGTYTEVDAKGSQVNKVTGDDVRISARNAYHGVKGDNNITADGEINIRAGTDLSTHADGSMHMLVRGDNEVQINGDFKLRIGQDYRLKCSKLYIEADELHFIGNNGVSIRSGKDINMHAAGGINSYSKGDMQVKSDGAMKQSVKGATSMTSGEAMKVDAKEIRLAEKGEEAKEAPKANDSNLPAVKELTKAKIKEKPIFSAKDVAVPRYTDGAKNYSGGSTGSGSGGGSTGSGSSGGSGHSGDINDPKGPVSNSGAGATGSNNSNTATPNAKPNPETQSARTQQAYQYFMDQGYSPAASAGIVGNLVKESRMNPNAINRGDGADGSNSIGIGQWNQDRAQNLNKFAAGRGTSPNDFNTQLAFVNHELNTNKVGVKNSLMSNPNMSPGEAADIVNRRYEVSADRTGERQANAEDIFNRYGATGKEKNDTSQQSGQDDGGHDSSVRATAPVKDKSASEEDKKYNTDLNTGEGVKNFLNTAPAREGVKSKQIKEKIEDQTVTDVAEVARNKAVPVDMIYLIASWEGDGTKVNLSKGKAEEIATKALKSVDALKSGLGRMPMRGEIYLAYKLGDSEAIKLVKKVEDKAQRDKVAQEVTDEKLKKKDDGLNKDTDRTYIEVYNTIMDRIPNSRAVFNVSNTPPMVERGGNYQSLYGGFGP